MKPDKKAKSKAPPTKMPLKNKWMPSNKPY
jgi:hypothetical protein